MHLDAAGVRVVVRAVLEGRDVEIAAELAVDAVQHVQVERGGHALRVVVRGVQHARGLS